MDSPDGPGPSLSACRRRAGARLRHRCALSLHRSPFALGTLPIASAVPITSVVSIRASTLTGSRAHRLRTVLHDAFERPHAPLAEIEPAGERFDAHPQVLHLDAVPRRLENEVVQDLVVEQVPLRTGPLETRRLPLDLIGQAREIDEPHVRFVQALLELDFPPRVALEHVEVELGLC